MAIQLRRGQTSLWETQNPTLDDGQVGIEKRADLPPRLKIGDGNAAWNDLDYSIPDADIYQDNGIHYNGERVLRLTLAGMVLQSPNGSASMALQGDIIRMSSDVTGSSGELALSGNALYPSVTNSVSLGTSSNQYSNVYTNKVTIGSLALVYDSDANSINVENA